jgi:hypothetical protein
MFKMAAEVACSYQAEDSCQEQEAGQELARQLTAGNSSKCVAG